MRDEETAAWLSGAGSAPQVGQFYFDVAKHYLHCLNSAAKRMRDAWLPLTGDHPALGELRTPDGKFVRGDELPLAVALREGRSAEAEFLLTRPKFEAQVHYSAAPLKNADGQIGAVIASVLCVPPTPDWPALAGLAHDLRTPLQTLSLSLHVLEFRTLPEAQRAEALQRLNSAADRAQQIGKKLLDWCCTRGSKTHGPQLE